VFYSYDPSKNLDNIDDEANLSSMYDEWIKNKNRSGIGLFFLNEESVGLNQLLNNFNEIRGKVTNGNEADSNQYFATRLNSLFSNNGLKQFYKLVYKLYKHKSDKGITSPDNVKSSILQNYINDPKTGWKSIFPTADSNPFVLDTIEQFEEFLDNFKVPLTPIKNLYEKSRTYGLLSKLDDLRTDGAKKYNFESSFEGFKIDFQIQKGFIKEYLTKNKIDAKTDNQTAKNKVALIDGDFKTRFRISPIEIAIDIKFFRSLLNAQEEIERVSTNPQPKSTSTEDVSYEKENLVDDAFEDLPEETVSELPKEEIVKYESNLDLTSKEGVVKIANLDEELVVEDKTTNLDESITQLLSVQKYRFGNINQLFSFASERLYYDIVLPSSYLDLEKGTFIKEEEVDNNILNAKMNLIKDIIKRSNKTNVTPIVFKDVKYDSLNDFINDESVPLRSRINTIIKEDSLRIYLNSDKPKDLYYEYQRIKEKKEREHSVNRGSENDVIKQYVDYVILKDFDLFVKEDENIKSRIVNAEGKYVRRKQKGFDKSFKESSEIDIREAGTDLFTTTIETIPLIEKIGDGYRETGKLQYSKIMNLFIDMKSDSRWRRVNIHDELKSIIFDKMINKKNKKDDPDVPLHERNMYRSLYYFLYSPSDINFTDKFNQNKTYKSIDYVLKNTNSNQAKLFHTAIENIINTMNRNYQMGIVKEGDEFKIVDPVQATSEKYKAMVISQSLNFINDNNKESFLQTKPFINSKRKEIPVVKYKNIDGREYISYNILSPFRFIDDKGILTPYGISWMKLNEPNYFTAKPNDQNIYMKNLNEKLIQISNMIHILKLSKSFENKDDLEKEVSNLLVDRETIKFFNEMKKEGFDVEKLGKSFTFLSLSENLAAAIKMTLDQDEKSVQQSLDGKSTAKFTPMNNTLELFTRVLRDKEEGSDILFKNDLIDLLNNC
jgi:hypothetical protein